MKPRKPDETDEHYIRRLEDQNKELKRRNDSMSSWQERLNEAITALSCEGSLAFQAMAEKAGLRSHPSVTEAVKLFDMVSHPQYRSGEEKLPKIEFPTFWDLDSPTAWSGDADMALNAPIAETIEFLDSLKFSGNHKQAKFASELIGRLHQVLIGKVDGIKDARGFRPKHLAIPSGSIANMDKETLQKVVEAVSWMALDLAQDMAFANEALRRDLRAATYRRVCADLYRLAWFGPEIPEDSNFNIKIFGADAPF